MDDAAEVRMRFALVVFALLIAVPLPVRAAELAHREVLPNGIVLLVAERPAVPIVAVRVSHRAGAAFDPPDHAGLANLTGAVITRGTAKRSGPELDAAIEFVGGHLEAGAGRDGLSESLSILKRDLGLGLDLLQEVVLTPSFPDAEVKRKITEIQAAIQRSEESPEAVAMRALARLTFPHHPYGIPVEGTKESVGALTRDDIVQFYRTYVRPDTTVIAIVGAVTVDEARREVMSRFGSWPRPSAAAPPLPGTPTAASPASETIKKDLTQATMLLGRQAINQRDPEYFPLTVASYILGGGSASRLYSRVREEGGLAYAVYSYVAPGRYGASFIVTTQTRTAEVAKVGDVIREELGRMARERVTDRELALAKAYLIGSFPLRLDTSAKVADFLIAIEELGLGLDYADRYRERIGRVTADDVLRVAGHYFPPQTFNRVVVGAAP